MKISASAAFRIPASAAFCISASTAFLLPVPALATAQGPPAVPDSVVVEPVPPNLAEVELARSRTCVRAAADLAALERDLQPLYARAARLQALDRAVALEDSTQVAPFDGTDALESDVRQWFVKDGALGQQWAQSRDTAIARQRGEARTAIRQRIAETMQEIEARVRSRGAGTGDLQDTAVLCDGAILVRSAVVEACETATSPVCDVAADTAADLRFVPSPEDLWDVEEFRPWTDPSSLHVLPQGNLGGARSAARARRGNVVVVLAVAPLIRDRSQLGPEQVAEFDANLDSLGFTFEHPRLLFAPALEIQLNVAEPLGGETHYMLHFGDLSDPENQVIWSAPVGAGGPMRALFPAGRGTLALLERGEMLHLTALEISEDSGDQQKGEAVYTISLPAVNQARAVGSLLAYMAGGQFSADVSRLVPPDTTAAGGGAG